MMLHLLDRLAGWWLDWRTSRAVAEDSELKQFDLRRFDATPEGMTLVAIAPAVVMFADEAATLLEAHNAKNYIEFDLMPRLDRGLRPVRVTVQWANGESPAVKAARLEAELTALRGSSSDGS